MQWKIARPGRFADRFNRWALHRGFPALAWLAPRAPRPLLQLGARFVISVVMGLHHRPKRAIAANLGRVLGLDPSSREVRRAVRTMLRHFAYYWLDLFRFAQLPPAAAAALTTTIEGCDEIARLEATGRPLLLLTGHLGNWELGGVLLGQSERKVSVVYVADQFAEAERFRSFLRGQGGVEEIPIRPREPLSALPVLRALREGRIVALQGDRDFDDQGIERDFFGAPVRFPAGPFHLARMTGATLVPVFVVYDDAYRFRIEFGTPIEVAATADRDADVGRALGEWVALLERTVRRYPTQWYTFFDYWGTGATAGEAA
jgi:KDO2-lipid IV(A) lauroyltransferase